MSPPTILVIDDEPNLRLTLSDILCAQGYSVLDVGHAADALRLLEGGAFDLMFLDLQMPDVNGLTLLAQVRQRYPDMPVLILTAHASLETAIEAVRLGASDYLFKPVAPQVILARVAQVLAEQQRRQREHTIVAQIQSLFDELQSLRSAPAGAASLAALTALGVPDSSARFLRRSALIIDLQTRQATWGERLLELSPSAFDYLVTLARHAPEAVTFEDLVKYSQGYTVDRREAQELVRWRMHQLRRVIEPDPNRPRHILTVRGVGYRLCSD
jgi:DNA-binding response OmpR family regulator